MKTKGEIREDLLFLKSKKLTESQKKPFFMGLTCYILVEESILKSIGDVHRFIDDNYIPLLRNPPAYKGYECKSRFLISSYLAESIFEDAKHFDVIKCVDLLLEYFPPEAEQKPVRKPKRSKPGLNVAEWMNAVSPKS